MRTFERRNKELNEMIDFIRQVINIPRNGRNKSEFKICVRYFDDMIKVYPSEGETIYLSDDIFTKATELELESMIEIRNYDERTVPVIMLY